MTAGMVVIAAAASPVAAQTAPATQDSQSTALTPAPNAEPTGTDIVVTAQKRAESLQKVPISIVAFDGKALEDANVFTVTDLQRIAPSLNIARSTNSTNQRVTVRGVGTGSSSAIEPSVAFFLDGVYVPRAGSIIGNLVDIAGVEVLRGPQGTLFGRNASVGAISIKTADPAFERSASASLIAGNYGRLRSELVLNQPLSDTLAVRIAGAAERNDGDFTSLNPFPHGLGKLSTVYGRTSLLWKPTAALAWKVKADYQQIDGDGLVPYEIAPETLPANNSFAARTDPDGVGSATGPSLSTGDPYDRVVSNYLFGITDDRVWGISSDLSYDVSGYTLRLLSGYRDWRSAPVEGDTLQTPLPLVRRNQLFRSKAQSHELQFISPERGLLGGALDFVSGLYFYRETYGIDTVVDLLSSYCRPFIANVLPTRLAACLAGPQNAAGSDFFDQTTTSKAGYLQATVHASDAVRFTLGGRYTDDRKHGRFVQVHPNLAEVFHGLEDTPLSLDEDRFTWRAGAQVDISRDTMLFATYSTGFKSGGFNSTFSTAALGQGRVFSAETVDNYEAGLRSELLARRVTLNATLYRTTIDGLQDRGFDGLIYTIRNVGSLRQQGVEFEAMARPLRALSLGVSGAYLKSRFLDFRNAPPLPAFTGVQNLTGTRANFSPKWQGDAYGEYSGKLANRWGVLARADLKFQSRSNIGSDQNANPDTEQSAYQLLSARVGITTPDDRFTLSLFGDNLTDKGYCVFKAAQPGDSLLGVRNSVTGATAIRCVVGQPRRYGVQLRVQFR